MTMETKAFNIDVNVTSQCQTPLLGLFSTVVITQTHQFQEFIVNENGGNLTSLSLFPASSSPNPKIILQLETVKPDDVYQILNGRLHDHVLSQKVSDEIVLEAQKLMSQGFQQPLFMEVLVKLTQNVYNVVPSCSFAHSDPSATDLDQEGKEEWEKTCAICLEEMLRGSQDNMQTPYCLHWFHENCFGEWLSRNNSCPLCRQPVYQEPW